MTSTGITASITPISATSKILVLCSTSFATSAANVQGVITVYRGATNLMTEGQGMVYSSGGASLCAGSLSYLDSPATTSALTYKTQFHRTAGASSVSVQQNAGDTSTIVLMEIAG